MPGIFAEYWWHRNIHRNAPQQPDRCCCHLCCWILDVVGFCCWILLLLLLLLLLDLYWCFLLVLLLEWDGIVSVETPLAFCKRNQYKTKGYSGLDTILMIFSYLRVPRPQCHLRHPKKSPALKKPSISIDTVDGRILHHLECIKPYKSWGICHISWCRISSINSIKSLNGSPQSHWKFRYPSMVAYTPQKT